MTPTPRHLPALAAVVLSLLGPLNIHDLFDTSEIVGGFGKIRFESGPFSSAGQTTQRETVQNIRLGLVFRY
jgi:hypothetical protein